MPTAVESARVSRHARRKTSRCCRARGRPAMAAKSPVRSALRTGTNDARRRASRLTRRIAWRAARTDTLGPRRVLTTRFFCFSVRPAARTCAESSRFVGVERQQGRCRGYHATTREQRRVGTASDRMRRPVMPVIVPSASLSIRGRRPASDGRLAAGLRSRDAHHQSTGGRAHALWTGAALQGRTTRLARLTAQSEIWRVGKIGWFPAAADAVEIVGVRVRDQKSRAVAHAQSRGESRIGLSIGRSADRCSECRRFLAQGDLVHQSAACQCRPSRSAPPLPAGDEPGALSKVSAFLAGLADRISEMPRTAVAQAPASEPSFVDLT